MDQTSRVKIEYTDPSEVYPQFASELSQRLPLRDLHWASASRPIRSINSLHVELVPNQRTTSDVDLPSTEGPFGAKESRPPPKTEGARKERRHQIPGLRQTPYLKIYLLQCNDVDTYRASARKHLREWVKDNTSASQSSTPLSKQENHDAYEWLVVHVIPRSADGSTDTSGSSSNKGDNTVEKRPTSMRWSSRSSTTVIEKLRSEFNNTSKNAVDRVTQIQLTEAPADGARQTDLRETDEKKGLGDLVFKLKALILASFDSRVSQYEEDIREREGQRQVFGWNFNTFFVLKEGLAMGFENMGLLDDALTVYQELAFGLKNIIQEQQSVEVEQQAAHFVDFTEDLYTQFTNAKSLGSNAVGETSGAGNLVADPGALILDTARKPFRDLILANKISFFDFQCYIFARKVSISLRLANAPNRPSRSKRTSAPRFGHVNEEVKQQGSANLSEASFEEPENLILLAEVARSSIEFITSTVHTVREDVFTAIKQSQASKDENEAENTPTPDGIVDNFVTSWMFSSCQCILEAISARSLSAQVEPLIRQLSPKASATNSSADIPHTIGESNTNNTNNRNSLPARTSSLPPNSPPKVLPPLDGLGVSASSSNAANITAPANHYPGLADLAAARGDILALRMRLLGDLGLRHGGWEAKLANFVPVSKTGVHHMQDVNLDEGVTESATDVSDTSDTEKVITTTSGLCNQEILFALGSEPKFYKAYESLTTLALVHYTVGNRMMAAEVMTASLATSRFRQKDYSSAALYFRQLMVFYAKSNWSDLEITMLDAYAQCLNHLGKIEDYIRIRLKTLAEIIDDRRTIPSNNVPGSLGGIVSASEALAGEISVPMDDYFKHVELSKFIHHFSDRDGFELSLELQSLLPENLEIQSIRARLVCTEEDQRTEIWLATESPRAIKPGLNELTLISNLMQSGWYALDKIYIHASKIKFTLDLSPPTETPLFPRNSISTKQNKAKSQQRLLVWPRPESLDVRLTHYERINLEQPNLTKVTISAGWNDIGSCKLSMRAASAGLRLHTAEARVLSGDTAIAGRSQPGSIEMSQMSAETTTSIIIPYSVEHDPREITLRALLEYSTAKGDYTFSCSASLPIFLPLAINVQDTFKQDMLVSKFTIGPSTPVPVRISSCYLEGNDDFHVSSGPAMNVGLDVFPRQPFTLISKIHQNSKDKGTKRPTQNKLFLQVEYSSLLEEIRAAVEQAILDDLAITPFQKYSCVLRRSLLAILDERLAVQDLEAISVCREMYLGSFEEWAWDAILAGLPSTDRLELRKWLQDWHKKHPIVVLDSHTVPSQQQHLTVPVEIPRMQVVQTAKLQCLEKSSFSLANPQPLPIGQGLPMELSISHTRRWDLAASVAEPRALKFCYEVQANPDIWLVGGQRKGHFSAKEDEITKFSLLLWPQKTGHLLLPTLDTRLLATEHDSSEGSSTTGPVSCELDFKNVGETVLVVPDLISTTVSLDPGGVGGGWLVESRSKTPA